MPSNTYDFTLPAAVGGFRLIQASGNRCKLVTCLNGPVKVQTNSGAAYNLLPGQGFELPEGREFRELYITNLSGVAVIGTLVVGDETFIDDRVSGTVEIVDGERNKVASGVVFSAVADVAGSGFAPRIQLWNQAGSGRVVVVTAVTLGSKIADSWGLKTQTTQLANLAPLTPFNHDSAGPAPTAAQLRQDTTNGALAGEKFYKIGYLQASADRVVVLPKPLVLRPGVGAMVYAFLATTKLRASFEFEEWPL